MIIQNSIPERAVWDHWMIVEHHVNINFRKDIRGILPQNTFWFSAKLEDKDLDKLFIISSDDWKDISDNTFKVLRVSENINKQSINKDTQRLSEDIKRKINFINSGGKLDNTLFLVAVSEDGPFTLIEGNRRAVAFNFLNIIMDCPVFLGISLEMNKYLWARYSFKNIHGK